MAFDPYEWEAIDWDDPGTRTVITRIAYVTTWMNW